MNTENILRLAEFLEALPQGRFNMASWARSRTGQYLYLEGPVEAAIECGTVCCIGGWGVLLFDIGDSSKGVAKKLGLGDPNGEPPDPIASELFFPKSEAINERDPHKAARVLRHLAETGEVDWSIA